MPRMEHAYTLRVDVGDAEGVELVHGRRADLVVGTGQEDVDDKVAHGRHVVERRCTRGKTKKASTHGLNCCQTIPKVSKRNSFPCHILIHSQVIRFFSTLLN